MTAPKPTEQMPEEPILHNVLLYKAAQTMAAEAQNYYTGDEGMSPVNRVYHENGIKHGVGFCMNHLFKMGFLDMPELKPRADLVPQSQAAEVIEGLEAAIFTAAQTIEGYVPMTFGKSAIGKCLEAARRYALTPPPAASEKDRALKAAKNAINDARKYMGRGYMGDHKELYERLEFVSRQVEAALSRPALQKDGE